MPKFLSLTLITATLFSLAAIHNVVYFTAVDIRLITFLQFSDYLSNAMAWLPYYILLGIIITFFEFSDAKKKKEENELDKMFDAWASSLNWKLLIHPVFMTSVLFLMIGYYFKLSNFSQNGLYLLLFFFMNVTIPNSRFLNYIFKKSGRATYIITLVFLYSSALVSIKGYQDAKADLTIKNTKYFLASDQYKSVVLMRALSTGLLIRDITKNSIRLVGHQEVIYKLPAIDLDTDHKE